MQKAVGSKKEMARRDRRDSNQHTRSVADGFLLTVFCFLPFSVPLCLCGNSK